MSDGERKPYVLHIGAMGQQYSAEGRVLDVRKGGFSAVEEQSLSFDTLKDYEGKVLMQRLLDPETRTMFDAKVILSQTPQEGYDELTVEAGGLVRVEGQWYVKILERLEGEELGEVEEAITIFEPKKLSDRRGYMLKSMMAEKKTERKKEIMTTELEERLRRRREIAEKILREREG